MLVKNLPANTGDTRDAGCIPELGKSPEIGNGNSPQYSCLGNSLDRGAWKAIVHEVTKSSTQLSKWACTGILHILELEQFMFYISNT